MTDDLLTFENTLAVLAEYGEAVAAAYKDNLRRDGRPASHALEKSIKTHVTTDHGDFVVQMDLEDYWKYIENDTRPHWPPREAILRWVEIKPTIPRPYTLDGREISAKSLAYLVGRKIAEKGTTGTHDMATAKEQTMDAFRQRLRQAVGHDVINYIRKVTPGAR